MSLSKHKSHNYATVQMVRWLSSVSPKLYKTAHTGSNPVWVNFFFFFSQPFFTANSCQLKFVLTMMGYYMEPMKSWRRQTRYMCWTNSPYQYVSNLPPYCFSLICVVDSRIIVRQMIQGCKFDSKRSY